MVVTSHRVLTFTPDADGEHFRQVDRPNVVGVGLSHDGNAGLLERGVKWGLIGVILTGAGQVVSLDGLVSDISFGSGAGAVGLGGILGLLQTMLDLIARLDEFMTIAGALTVIVAMGVLGLYMTTRDRVLRIELAGQEDLLVPVASDVDEGVVERLEAALTASPDGNLKSDDPLGSPDGTDGGT
ncbi:hypothetical protein VB773_05185 [Haloarculaceae archaeon H-GB2-1]|nr:hypothetical protein [Haloarculaceae archaeon H-GB2-1]